MEMTPVTSAAPITILTAKCHLEVQSMKKWQLCSFRLNITLSSPIFLKQLIHKDQVLITPNIPKEDEALALRWVI